jgi:hypothetical protein
VFILSIGYYVTPALLGADDQMLSYYIAQYTNVNVNWAWPARWVPCCCRRRWCSMPPYDASGNTALLAANLLFEMLCVLPGVARR